jgi:2-polyprenyl-3-methyl-5-hydroxy-6-metoxy-1,4-benzoquinol methylase
MRRECERDTTLDEQQGPQTAQGREVDFWGHHVPSLDECIEIYGGGPDKNTKAMLDALEPLGGKTVLDFACGVGLTTAWLAARGAEVTGVDITPAAIERATRLCAAAGLHADLACCDLSGREGQQLPMFDRVTGKFALHHVDVSVFGPVLSSHLKVGGVGAFLETVYTNPLLYLMRRFVAGRFGIVSFGTPDEKPLARAEFRQLAATFGRLRLELGEMIFLTMLDRQVLRFRSRVLSRLCRQVDDYLYRWPRLHWLSYQRLLVVNGGVVAP